MKKKKRILFAMLAITAVLVFAACSPAPSPAPAAPAAAPAAPPAMPAAEAPAAADVADAAPMEPAAPPPAPAFPEASDGDYFQLPILAPSDAGERRLVYHVSMRLQTTDFLPGQRTLLDAIGEMGGYLIFAEIRGYDMSRPTQDRSADFHFRVPTERLAEFIVVMENNYNIWNLTKVMQDDTAAYQRTTWNLEDLREEETQLQADLENAQGDARTQILNRLLEIRRAIREHEVAQATIMHTVIYSMVDVQLFEAILPEYVEDASVHLAVWLAVLFVAGAGIFIFIVRRASSKEEAQIGR